MYEDNSLLDSFLEATQPVTEVSVCPQGPRVVLSPDGDEYAVICVVGVELDSGGELLDSAEDAATLFNPDALAAELGRLAEAATELKEKMTEACRLRDGELAMGRDRVPEEQLAVIHQAVNELGAARARFIARASSAAVVADTGRVRLRNRPAD